MPIHTLNPSSSNNRKKPRPTRQIYFTGVGRILGTGEEVTAKKRKRSDDEEGDKEYLPAQDAGKDEDGDGDGEKVVGKCERKGGLGSDGEMGWRGGGEEGKEKQEVEKDVERVGEGQPAEMKGVYDGEHTPARPVIGSEVRRCENRGILRNLGDGRKKARFDGLAIPEEMVGGVGGNEAGIARGSLRSGVKRGFWKYGEGRVLGS